MIERTEFHLKTSDTQEPLFLQRWKPKDWPPDITLFVTHGVAEHSECHHLMAEALANNRVEVFAWDLPGHGKSYGLRGYISNFAEYSQRLQEVLNEVKKLKQSTTPLFLFGHSLGGLITLHYALHNSGTHGAQGICLSSPALGLALQVPLIKDQISRILVKVAPKLTVPHQLEYADLTRDKALVATYSKDPLRHTKYSAPLYLGTLETMEEVNARAHQLRDRIFIQAAGLDRIVDVRATEAFFQRIGSADKTLKVYPESFHEIFNDINRQEVVEDLLGFLRGTTHE